MRKFMALFVASAFIAFTSTSAQIYVQPEADAPGVVECGMIDADGYVNCSFRETSDPFVVTDTQVADCVEVVFAKNRMTERDARRIQAGTSVNVLGVSQRLNAGETVWGVCGTRLRNMALAARYREAEADWASLMTRYAELARQIEELRAEYDARRTIHNDWLGLLIRQLFG